MGLEVVDRGAAARFPDGEHGGVFREGEGAEVAKWSHGCDVYDRGCGGGGEAGGEEGGVD